MESDKNSNSSSSSSESETQVTQMVKASSKGESSIKNVETKIDGETMSKGTPKGSINKIKIKEMSDYSASQSFNSSLQASDYKNYSKGMDKKDKDEPKVFDLFQSTRKKRKSLKSANIDEQHTIYSTKNPKTQNKIFCFSGFRSHTVRTFMEAVRTLKKAKIQEDAHRPYTHLINVSGTRTLKTVVALSRGAWILTEDYITKSLEAEGWQEETDYEHPEYIKREERAPTLYKLFKGYQFLVSEMRQHHIIPFKLLELIINNTGGKFISKTKFRENYIKNEEESSKKDKTINMPALPEDDSEPKLNVCFVDIDEYGGDLSNVDYDGLQVVDYRWLLDSMQESKPLEIGGKYIKRVKQVIFLEKK